MQRHTTILACAAALALGSALAAGPAQACTIWQNANQLPLHFKQGEPISFYIQSSGSPDIEGELEFDAILAAFASWETADCGDGGPALTFAYEGTLDTEATNFDPRFFRDEKNMVAFISEGWEGDPSVLARARILWDSETGEIMEFGIALNDQYADWSLQGEGQPGAFDVQAVLTRQIGLVLGLGDSEVPTAVMNPGLSSGDTSKRALDTDDVLAICELYAPGREYTDAVPEDANCAYDLHPGARPPDANNGDPNNGEVNNGQNNGDNNGQNNGDNNGDNNGQNNGGNNGGNNDLPAEGSVGVGGNCTDSVQCLEGLICGCPFESCQANVCYEFVPEEPAGGSKDEGCAAVAGQGGHGGLLWLALGLVALGWRRR